MPRNNELIEKIKLLSNSNPLTLDDLTMEEISRLYDILLDNKKSMLSENDILILDLLSRDKTPLTKQEEEIYQDLVEGQDTIFYMDHIFASQNEQYRVMARIASRMI